MLLPARSGYRTTIIRNGPDGMRSSRRSVKHLLALLSKHPLNPLFSPFMAPSEVTSDYRFFGNFDSIAHPFNIETNDPDVIEKLSTAIQKNQKLKPTEQH